MTLPDDFAPLEHVQDVMKKIQNAIVREEFSDVGGDDWEPNINTSRNSLRTACMHREDDPAILTNLRNQLYYIVLRKAQDLQIPYYGMPIHTYKESVEFKPQVQLYFSESYEDSLENDRKQINSEVTFRLMNETEDTLNAYEMERLARKIKAIFATPIYKIRRGKTKTTYRDEDKGYRLSICVWDGVEGRRLFDKVLQIQDHSLELENFSDIERGRNPPKTNKKKKVLGQTVKEIERRPIATLRFRYAALKVCSLDQDQILVDASGRHKDALLRV